MIWRYREFIRESKHFSSFSGEVDSSVQELFYNNSELSSTGTITQYLGYLDSIFPLGKIFYRGDSPGLEKFHYAESIQIIDGIKKIMKKFGSGIYLTTNLPYAEEFARQNNGKVYLVLVNWNNVVPFKDKMDFLERVSEFKNTELMPTAKDIDEYTKFLQGKNGILYIKTSGVADELVVGDNSKLHILGSERDIKDFKKYI
jgi:hypothetical protein